MLISLLFYTVFGFAKTNTVEFFYSNNDRLITMHQAYNRLIGKEQKQLEKKAIPILQNAHLEQGYFKSALGTYTLSSNQTTADNTEVFYVSPLQKLPFQTILSVASRLANQLNQESVAVFIPSNAAIAHIKLIFLHKPSIHKAVQFIHNNLPIAYAQAFSLRLQHEQSGFNHAKVQSIEWLGNNLNQALIESQFPNDKVLSDRGEAYLVFKDGRYQKM